MNELPFLATPLIIVSIAYLLGSIPTAFLVSKSKGIDIFAVGTQSAGASNVFSNIGKTKAAIVMLIDVLKAGIAVAIPIQLGQPDAVVLAAAYAAIIGHWHSIFTKFRGGDGMASMIGIITMLVPSIAVMSMLIGTLFILIFSRWRSRTCIGLFVCTVAIVILGRSGVYPATTIIGLSFLSLSIIIHSLYKRARASKHTVPERSSDQIPMKS